jgi:hypothetical protein
LQQKIQYKRIFLLQGLLPPLVRSCLALALSLSTRVLNTWADKRVGSLRLK